MFPGGRVRLLTRITLLLSGIVVIGGAVPTWLLAIPLILVCVGFQGCLKSSCRFCFFTHSSPDLQDPSSEDLHLWIKVVAVPGDGGEELVGVVYVVPALRYIDYSGR